LLPDRPVLEQRKRRAPGDSGCGGRGCDFRSEPLDLRLQTTHICERAFGEDGEFFWLAGKQFAPQRRERLIHAFQLLHGLGQDGFGLVHRRNRSSPFLAAGASRTSPKNSTYVLYNATQLRNQLAKCADGREWHALVYALADLAETRETVELLLGFLNEPDKRGPIIDTLGQIGKEPESVLPRLIELLDTFEEYDPDWSYHGEHERVVQALRGFGTAAAVAVPALIRHIWTKPQQY